MRSDISSISFVFAKCPQGRWLHELISFHTIAYHSMLCSKGLKTYVTGKDALDVKWKKQVVEQCYNSIFEKNKMLYPATRVFRQKEMSGRITTRGCKLVAPPGPNVASNCVMWPVQYFLWWWIVASIYNWQILHKTLNFRVLCKIRMSGHPGPLTP